jgi:DeoR/GlpR family transcriptional regulator of sugar metabolism
MHSDNARKQARTAIAEYLRSHSEITFKQLALTLNCSPSTIATIARQHGIVRQRKALTTADTAKLGV